MLDTSRRLQLARAPESPCLITARCRRVRPLHLSRGSHRQLTKSDAGNVRAEPRSPPPQHTSHGEGPAQVQLRCHCTSADACKRHKHSCRPLLLPCRRLAAVRGCRLPAGRQLHLLLGPLPQPCCQLLVARRLAGCCWARVGVQVAACRCAGRHGGGVGCYKHRRARACVPGHRGSTRARQLCATGDCTATPSRGHQPAAPHLARA